MGTLHKFALEVGTVDRQCSHNDYQFIVLGALGGIRTPNRLI
jgi:hypothetical protein